MPPYARAVSRLTQLPVYDLTTLVDWAVASVDRQRFADPLA
jgi:hypothetical protein